MDAAMSRSWVIRAAASSVVALLLGGCGGGASTVENPVTSTAPQSAYNGPAPSTADVQAFKINVWDNLDRKSVV